MAVVDVLFVYCCFRVNANINPNLTVVIVATVVVGGGGGDDGGGGDGGGASLS